jgi:hypothetical protein
VFARLTYNFKNNTFIKLFTSENLNDGLFLSNIREIWKTYSIKRPEDLNLYMEKETDLQTRNEQIKLNTLAQQNGHSGFILHKADIGKVDEKNLFEFQGDRRMKYINIYFSVSEDLMNGVRKEMKPRQNVSVDNDYRSIIQIKAQKRPEITDETFLSNRDKLVRLNRSGQNFKNRLKSPNVRLGTQIKQLRSSKESLVSPHQLEEIQIRPETEKAHKRIMSSGFGVSKGSAGFPTKVFKGFGLSVRTLYGKNTPLAFTNVSGPCTPANEYADTSKSWMVDHKNNKEKEQMAQKSKVAKTREIERIMKRLGQAEQERNVSVFKSLIKEEKGLHKELLDLDKNQRERDILRKRFMVCRANKKKK